MLTAYIVDSLSDGMAETSDVPDGNLTLREAIIASNTDAAYGDAPAGSGFDEISFNILLAGGTLTLEQGQLEITSGLQIDGAGLVGANVAVDGDGASRVFRLDTAEAVSLTNLTIQNGLTGNGAGLFVTGGGNLNALNVTVSGNTADGLGLDDMDDSDGSDTTGGGGGGRGPAGSRLR